ncbi:hypothetical protein JCM30204_08060 [Dysgonomonas termitidis]
MLEIEFLKGRGFHTDWSREEYMKRMGLKEYSFDKSVKRLMKLGLLAKKNNQLGNRVFYSFNVDRYEKLVMLLSNIGDIDGLIRFCDIYFNTASPRLPESITRDEIQPFAGEPGLKIKKSGKQLCGETDPEHDPSFEKLKPLCSEIIKIARQMEEITGF